MHRRLTARRIWPLPPFPPSTPRSAWPSLAVPRGLKPQRSAAAAAHVLLGYERLVGYQRRCRQPNSHAADAAGRPYLHDELVKREAFGSGCDSAASVRKVGSFRGGRKSQRQSSASCGWFNGPRRSVLLSVVPSETTKNLAGRSVNTTSHTPEATRLMHWPSRFRLDPGLSVRQNGSLERVAAGASAGALACGA